MLAYNVFSIPKKNGKRRVIKEPCFVLKEMQYAILERLNKIPLSKYAHGFVSGRDIVTNAREHRRQRYVLNVDIENFFPSIKPGFMRYQLRKYYSEEEIEWIMAVCFWENCLPQGAPTSPVLANIYLEDMDYILGEVCEGGGWNYTRYADDLTISGGDSIKERLPQILDLIDHWLGHYGLVRNKKKTKLMPYFQRQVVTGIVVNNERLTLSRVIKESLYVNYKGKPAALLTEEERGYLEHVRHVDPRAYEKICLVMT